MYINNNIVGGTTIQYKWNDFWKIKIVAFHIGMYLLTIAFTFTFPVLIEQTGFFNCLQRRSPKQEHMYFKRSAVVLVSKHLLPSSCFAHSFLVFVIFCTIDHKTVESTEAISQTIFTATIM